MNEVSYSNVPPLMAAIRGGDIETLRSLLHAGHSPNEPQYYQVTIGKWPRDDKASPLELAVLEKPAQSRPDPVFLFGRCGSQNPRNAKGYMQAVSPLGGSG